VVCILGSHENEWSRVLDRRLMSVLELNTYFAKFKRDRTERSLKKIGVSAENKPYIPYHSVQGFNVLYQTVPVTVREVSRRIGRCAHLTRIFPRIDSVLLVALRLSGFLVWKNFFVFYSC